MKKFRIFSIGRAVMRGRVQGEGPKRRRGEGEQGSDEFRVELLPEPSLTGQTNE